MSETAKTKTRRPIAGQLRKGDDRRRLQFTRDECIAGFWAALESLAVRYNDDRAKTFGKFLRREGRFTR